LARRDLEGDRYADAAIDEITLYQSLEGAPDAILHEFGLAADTD
jgi:hypothetical protein